jgi:fluoride exporter
MAALLVFLGAGLGGVARYGVNQLAVAWLGLAFPWATLAVNVVGSFLMGLCAEVIVARFGGWPEARLFLMTGVLGGFTTFSAFSLEAYALWARGEGGLAALYVGASVGLSIAALVAGFFLARAMG